MRRIGSPWQRMHSSQPLFFFFFFCGARGRGRESEHGESGSARDGTKAAAICPRGRVFIGGLVKGRGAEGLVLTVSVAMTPRSSAGSDWLPVYTYARLRVAVFLDWVKAWG